MKNITLILVLVVFLSGCSRGSEFDSEQCPETRGGVTIPVTISADQNPVASKTRIEYDDSTGVKKLIIRWSKTDEVGLFTDEHSSVQSKLAIEGDITNDGKSASFRGSLTVGTDYPMVYGYYPYNAQSVDPKAIPINLAGQSQGLIGAIEQMAALDFMAGIPIKGPAMSQPSYKMGMAFQSLLTILTFDVTNLTGAPMYVNSIKVEAFKGGNLTPFYTSATTDITTKDGSFGITPTSEAGGVVELSVTGGGSIAPSAKGRFNMLILPVAGADLATTLKIVVTTRGGEMYTQIKSSPSTGFVKGRRYIIGLAGLVSAWNGTYPLANDNYQFGGSGTVGDPYIIANVRDFIQFASNSGLLNYGKDKYYRLGMDIDLANKPWTTQIKSLNGNLDGAGYTISGLNVDEGAGDGGLITKISGGATLSNLNVNGSVVGGNAGGICANVALNSAISGCSFSGTVTGSKHTGGICGYASGTTEITACRNSGTISHSSNATTGNVGGIVGNSSKISITACYNTGSVSSHRTMVNVGGVVGNTSTTSDITACYNIGDIEVVDGASVKSGGIYGGSFAPSTINACYAVKPYTNKNTIEFGVSAWPSAGDHVAWTANASADGTVNKYWKSLGGWGFGVPIYPKLWWEK